MLFMKLKMCSDFAFTMMIFIIADDDLQNPQVAKNIKTSLKGLKVVKEDQRSIDLMVDRLDGRWSIGSYQISYAVK